MADKEKPEENAGKKKGLLGGTKVPLDGILLVVAPFVVFLLLFMYVMGLLPPKPMMVTVVGASTMDAGGELVGVEAGVEREVVEGEAVSPTAGDTGEPAQTAGEPAETAGEPAQTTGGSAASSGTSGLAEGSGDADRGPSDESSQTVAGGDAATEEESPAGARMSEERLERMKQLAKVYEQMNASSVAAIITSMEEEDAVGILSNMKPRNAAKVLASLDPEKAARMSLRLTE